jgi:hypothetical protein
MTNGNVMSGAACCFLMKNDGSWDFSIRIRVGFGDGAAALVATPVSMRLRETRALLTGLYERD